MNTHLLLKLRDVKKRELFIQQLSLEQAREALNELCVREAARRLRKRAERERYRHRHLEKLIGTQRIHGSITEIK